MSKIGNLYLEIQERLEQGVKPELVASELNVPLDWVLTVENNLTFAESDPEFG